MRFVERLARIVARNVRRKKLSTGNNGNVCAGLYRSSSRQILKFVITSHLQESSPFSGGDSFVYLINPRYHCCRNTSCNERRNPQRGRSEPLYCRCPKPRVFVRYRTRNGRAITPERLRRTAAASIHISLGKPRRPLQGFRGGNH